ncbi:MAG: hypothetical protein QN168_11735 [Armatimonadota bacterium]|nr:hypothetical protein [Armatimonadota bacterium]
MRMRGRLICTAVLVAAAVAGSACQVGRQPAPVGVRFLQVGEVERATDRAALSPVAWSPDGSRFAYGGRDGVWVHHLGDPAGRKIAEGAAVTAVAWSRAANALAFVDRGILWIVHPDGRSSRRVPVAGLVTLPLWAPGGDRLAFVVRPPGGPARLWITSPDGALLRMIGWDPRDRTVSALGWFPDALHLFVGLAAHATQTTTEWWRVRIAYPDVRRLEGPPRPALESALSPDGAWVAFVAEEEDQERAYVVRADGSGLHAVSGAARRIAGASWAPHGDKVAYAVLRSDGVAEIYVAATTGAARLHVTTYRLEFPDPAAGLSLAWSPDGRRLAYGTNTGAMAGPVWLASFRER